MKYVILVGAWRSGTMSMTLFFQTFGIDSYHEYTYLQLEGMKLHDNYTEDLYKIFPKKDIEFMENVTEPRFEASFRLSFFMYSLSKKFPEIEWLLMMRDPKETCNSFKKLCNDTRKNQPDGIEKYNKIENWVNCYTEIYLTIIRQVQLMDKKPKWLDFKKYTEGKYVKQLFELFDIPYTLENRMKAQYQLKKKINHCGEYELEDSYLYPQNYEHFFFKDYSIFEFPKQVTTILKNMCKEL